jgi:O-antigen/teichoic acid export membrane protein
MLYQVFVTALPILTTPYIARVLGLHANGIHSYTEGIVTYFMLLGALGTAMYGTRKIAYERNDLGKMTQSAWEIILLRFILLGITLGAYVITLCINNEYAYIYRIQIINILATAIDISWFFQGVEDFKKVTLRNMIVKFVYVICLLVFIKEPEDLQWYVLLVVGSAFFGNVLMWFYLKDYLVKKALKKPLKLFIHLKGSVALFIPQITNYVYALLDRSMLKWITDDTDNVGIYDQAQRLIRAITAILQSVGYVMLARISNLSAENNEQGIRQYIRKSMNFTLFLAFPIMFGLLGTAEDFIPLFLGDEYLEVIPVLKMLSILVLTMSLNSVLGVQLLISVGKEKKYAIATTTGAIVNVLVNIISIPRYGVLGACISSILAECIVFIISFVHAKEYLNLKQIANDNLVSFISSVLMYIIVLMIKNVGIVIGLRLALEVIVGAGVYFIVMLISNNEVMRLIISKLRKRG